MLCTSVIHPSTAQERSAWATERLCLGDALTAAEVARHCGVTIRAAAIMLEKIARVVAVYRDDDGRWRHVGK